MECETTGTVEIDVGIILKDFNLHGVQLYTEEWTYIFSIKIKQKGILVISFLLKYLDHLEHLVYELS